MATKKNTIPDDTMIVAENLYYDMDCYRTKRNNNVLVVGAAGAGKTRSVVIPNLLQATGSYVVSDPKGFLYKEYGDYLGAKGYNVQILNFDDPDNSIHYNPLAYIHDTKDVLKVAHMLVYGDMVENSKEDPFWNRSAEVLLIAIISYLMDFCPEEERTIDSILRMVESCQLNEFENRTSTPFHRIMDRVEKCAPNSVTARYYNQFSTAATRTQESILVSLTALIGKLNLPEIRRMMSCDETNIPEIGRKKTAFFVQVSDTDRAMDTLANIFFTQAINELCYEADNNCQDYKLPVPVRFILDDFATNCTINDFPRMISSIRSRGISTTLIVQAESQLAKSYGQDSDTIISNCDTYVYLGCNDLATAKNVAAKSDQLIQNILYMPIEVAWVFRRGEQPVKCNMFRLEEHEKSWLDTVDLESYRKTDSYKQRHKRETPAEEEIFIWDDGDQSLLFDAEFV